MTTVVCLIRGPLCAQLAWEIATSAVDLWSRHFGSTAEVWDPNDQQPRSSIQLGLGAVCRYRFCGICCLRERGGGVEGGEGGGGEGQQQLANFIRNKCIPSQRSV